MFVSFVVRDDLTSTDAWISSESGPTCPTDKKAGNSQRFDHGWQYFNYNESKWVSDETIIVEIN